MLAGAILLGAWFALTIPIGILVGRFIAAQASNDAGGRLPHGDDFPGPVGPFFHVTTDTTGGQRDRV